MEVIWTGMEGDGVETRLLIGMDGEGEEEKWTLAV